MSTATVQSVPNCTLLIFVQSKEPHFVHLRKFGDQREPKQRQGINDKVDTVIFGVEAGHHEPDVNMTRENKDILF